MKVINDYLTRIKYKKNISVAIQMEGAQNIAVLMHFRLDFKMLFSTRLYHNIRFLIFYLEERKSKAEEPFDIAEALRLYDMMNNILMLHDFYKQIKENKKTDSKYLIKKHDDFVTRIRADALAGVLKCKLDNDY